MSDVDSASWQDDRALLLLLYQSVNCNFECKSWKVKLVFLLTNETHSCSFPKRSQTWRDLYLVKTFHLKRSSIHFFTE